MNAHSTPQVAIFIETSKTFGREILQGISTYSRTHGPWSIYIDEWGPQTPLPEWIKTWQGDGIIARVRSRQMAERLARLRVPVVDTLQQVPELEMPAVFADDTLIAKLAFEHLHDRHLRQFAFVGVEKANWSHRRRDAFAEIACEQGFTCEIYSPLSRRRFAESWNGGQDDLADWLEALPKPIGLFAAHDLRALCVLDACRRRDIAIPEQVAVVGVDNDDVFCEVVDPTLTSIALQAKEIGYQSAALLDQLMRGNPPAQYPLPVPLRILIPRRSTNMIAVEDPAIASALELIRRKACEKISVSMIASQVNLTRRSLERRLMKLVGKTPHQLISEERVRRARQLLIDTDFTLEQIAQMAGFSSAAYLSVIIKEHENCTPTEFRQKP
ncbi:MAG: XylR family transcriptional regulator [Gimesia sp.]|uniref:XylR family transcriptional regulator n=1 Tax=Gimesia maris TaxID=122 RepID=A0A3D3R9J5_9PLAN|nr:XylR family transcriptional regulator [Gimesia sp.]HCO25266.1 XylR family transcriptional regulator [Gimesia maris]|tara:strand:- start:42333 stop:43487 length:1155 start_codon:yes stop_codon:yes gene_type:complete